jgi:hypothetical protein
MQSPDCRQFTCKVLIIKGKCSPFGEHFLFDSDFPDLRIAGVLELIGKAIFLINSRLSRHGT